MMDLTKNLSRSRLGQIRGVSRHLQGMKVYIAASWMILEGYMSEKAISIRRWSTKVLREFIGLWNFVMRWRGSRLNLVALSELGTDCIFPVFPHGTAVVIPGDPGVWRIGL